MAKYMIQDSTLSAIADAIRVQTGKDSSEKLSPAQMVNEIQGTLGDFPGLIGRTLTDIKCNGVDTVAPYAFYSYPALNSVEFPNCISVGNAAFQNCASLTYASMPQCTTVGASAFASCKALGEVYLPNCTTAPANAFTSCTQIKRATLGISGTISSSTFPFKVASSYISYLNLPNCTSIHASAFRDGYSRLTEVSFPACISASTAAFNSCKSIAKVTLGFSKLTSTNFPFRAAKSNILQVNFPNCEIIETFALAGQTIDGASNYPYLRYINFPVCSYIGINAFTWCSELSSINFPACTYIGAVAFGYCSKLTSIDLPVCTYVGDNVFDSCRQITIVDFPVCSYIGSSAFIGCFSLASVSLPACTSIGSNAFHYCSLIKNLTLGFSSFTSINMNLFISCRQKLQSINLPACTSIGSQAFLGLSGLTSIDLPVCTYVGHNAFERCSRLTSIDLPICTYVGNGAFSNCYLLTSVNLPACTSIANYAFYSCSNLLSVKLGGSSVVLLLSGNTFVNTPIIDSSYTGSFGSIYVPASLVSAYKVASYWSDIADRITAIPT